MKKDLKDEKLLDEQLGQVQGGIVRSPGITATIIYCLQPGCSWLYDGLVEGAAAAQHTHSNATGHNLFGPCKPADSFGH